MKAIKYAVTFLHGLAIGGGWVTIGFTGVSKDVPFTVIIMITDLILSIIALSIMIVWIIDNWDENKYNKNNN